MDLTRSSPSLQHVIRPEWLKVDFILVTSRPVILDRSRQPSEGLAVLWLRRPACRLSWECGAAHHLAELISLLSHHNILVDPFKRNGRDIVPGVEAFTKGA